MKFDNLFNFDGLLGISGLFYASGSFGVINGDEKYSVNKDKNKTTYTYNNGKIEFKSEFSEMPNGVVIRKDCIKNISNGIETVNKCSSRFNLDGNSYQVYTQYNGWQHESSGGFQKLVTEITAASRGIRTCEGATPMMALLNEYTYKSYVFHVVPNCQWKISAKKLPIYSKYETVVVEIGFNDEGLNFAIDKGETVFLPEIIFYQAENKLDFDAYKLHEVYNDLYPRKSLPVLYNSWLYCFDNLNPDEILKQADIAKELGVEAFMIDAGWFGKGESWAVQVGDWEENTTCGVKGRLKEIADRVRDNGMIFGLWFEPERAGSLSKTKEKYPEFYIDGVFFDFSNAKAREYMLGVICEKIERYGIGWLKFDFNDCIPYDKTGCAFYRYLQGQKQFVKEIKKKYPDIYITNCASGGYRMELEQASFTDSFWPSDNQSPLGGLDIVKNTLKRMPTGTMERWCVQKYAEGFISYGKKEKVGQMLYCNNATWDSIVNVKDDFEKAFLTGGPIGLSFDLTTLNDEYKKFWADFIKEYKGEREFFKTATARILVDNGNVVAIEYADKTFDKCVLQVFSKTVYATDLRIYPAVDKNCDYLINGNKVSGADLSENGYKIQGIIDNNCVICDLNKIKG